MEIWKPIKGYEGVYEVSNFGRIKSLEREIYRGKDYAKRVQKEKILKQVVNKDSYHRVSLNKNSKSKMFAVSRLVAEAFIPNPENKPEVNHIDANRFNNKVENLEWVTAEENLNHARENGLLNKMQGEKSWCSKLKESDVKEIRRLHASGKHNQKELSRLFGVHHSNVNLIVKNKSWSWLV